MTSIGHAGFLIETTGGTILCDPWFTPTYFGSWHPFPRVDTVDTSMFGDVDYLYVSHAHRDHLDLDVLEQLVSKSATVLLPEFGVTTLVDALRGAGFTSFIETTNGAVVDLPGDLRIAIGSLAGPHIGPMGDSMLVVQDPTAVVLNQNDAHPADLDVVAPFGRPDAHLLQYSGAIWYPMVYDIPADEEAALIALKRERQSARALQYIDMVDARMVVPSAGPPCFLDDDLFHLNDFTGCEPDAPATIFPDAQHFVSEMSASGHDNHRLMIPGSVLDVGGERDGQLAHPLDDAAMSAIFTEKRSYLERYRDDTAEQRAAIVAGWPTNQTDLLAELSQWLDPLLATAVHTRRGVGGDVELSDGNGFRVIIDMLEGRVRAPRDDDRPAFRFTADRRLLESSVQRRVEDWCNELFLSCRFGAHRVGPYNEFVYTFFKSLSPERMAYAEAHYAKQLADADDIEWVECDGWVVEQRCPHQRARLDRVGSVDGDVLTCGLHGWQFDLNTGRCINSDGVVLRVRGRVEHPED